MLLKKGVTLRPLKNRKEKKKKEIWVTTMTNFHDKTAIAAHGGITDPTRITTHPTKLRKSRTVKQDRSNS